MKPNSQVNLVQSTYRLFAVGLLFVIVANAGCTPQDELLDVIETDVARVKIDDLTRAMEFIKSEVRYDQAEFRDEVTNGLNRWVSYSSDELDRQADSWKPDPFASKLCEQFSDIESAKRADQFQFLTTDPYYLQQSSWINRLLRRLDAQNRLKTFELYRLAADNYRPSEDESDSLSKVFGTLQSELEGDDLIAFIRTMKVFDWVCRNIQLESDNELSEEDLAERTLNPSAESPAAAGTPGVGYQRLPWQVMMYGRGDYVERAKLMIAALRFWDIDSVMLATGESQTPWAVGVSINGNYYVFDTKLGLPLFREKVGSVATLGDLRTGQEILSGLDLTTEESLADNTKYWVNQDDLNSLTALVYVSPEAISKRINGLEKSLVGENRMKLFFGAQELVDRLPEVEGVTPKPWDIGFQTHQYRQVVRKSLAQIDDGQLQNKLRWFYVNEVYVDGFKPYRTARGRFFIGKFMVKKDERGLDALEGWQRLIYDDDQVASLGSDFELQRLHGLRRQEQSAAEFSDQVKSVQGQMRLIREDAKFFLAQCLFDNANENASGSWLEDLNAGDESTRWQEGVVYLLGRAIESRGDYDLAIETLKNESLNQAHGNILRTRYLKKLIETHFGDE